MQLKEIDSYFPSNFAYHLQNPVILNEHASSHYLAFVTRSSEVAFYNRKTGRTSVIFQSKHGITHLLFTQKYLVVIEKTTPEVIVFSIKSQKLKKKITGHRSQVLALAFNPQRQIICTASHDVCMVWDEATLSCLKVLKCSTSSYSDCHFTFNGQYLFTAFSDGNLFGWNLQNYEVKQYALSIEPHKIASACNQFLVAYSPKKVSVADFSLDSLVFEVIDSFWEGYIEKIDFLDSHMLIKTTHGFYLSEIAQQTKISLRNRKELADQINSFWVTKYGSQMLIASKDLTKLSTMRFQISPLNSSSPLTNPLINPGSHCMGGYSNSTGCLSNSLPQLATHDYAAQNLKVERMNDGLFCSTVSLSDKKLQVFIRKNFIFPDKYRALAYKNLLGLPISAEGFLDLQKKGRHSCVKMLDAKYPLANLALSEAMKDVLSLLAHYSPVFAEADFIPSIIFPFVCIFGEDRFFCFQILYSLFNNWLSCLFQNFPLANSELLQNVQELFQREDKALLNHLKASGISFTKLTWSLLSSLFSANLSRDGFLAVSDSLICHYEDPSFLIFMLMAYIEYNRSIILGLRSESDLDRFLEEEHTVNISVFIKKAYDLRDRLSKFVFYPLRWVNLRQNEYKQFEDYYPRHAVKMFEGKRRLEEQQFDKLANQQRYHQELAKEMEKMLLKIKRESDKALIESQAVVLQSQNQAKNVLNLPNGSTIERRKRLSALMSQLQQMLENRDSKKMRVKQFMPLLSQLGENENDSHQLDEIESKLMQMMAKLEPHQFQVPLCSQPMTFGKQRAAEFSSLKAAKRAQIANKLWETDKMGYQLQENRFEHDFDKAMKM